MGGAPGSPGVAREGGNPCRVIWAHEGLPRSPRCVQAPNGVCGGCAATDSLCYHRRMAKQREPKWRNRIVAHGEEDPAQLLANPANWRLHPGLQQEALESVMDEVGWVDTIIVNQRSGYVVDGHLRVSLALRRGEKTVPVQYVDLTDEEEQLILATLDPRTASQPRSVARTPEWKYRTCQTQEVEAQSLSGVVKEASSCRLRGGLLVKTRRGKPSSFGLPVPSLTPLPRRWDMPMLLRPGKRSCGRSRPRSGNRPRN